MRKEGKDVCVCVWVVCVHVQNLHHVLAVASRAAAIKCVLGNSKQTNRGLQGLLLENVFAFREPKKHVQCVLHRFRVVVVVGAHTVTNKKTQHLVGAKKGPQNGGTRKKGHAPWQFPTRSAT